MYKGCSLSAIKMFPLSWARCVYNSVADKLQPLVKKKTRDVILANIYRRVLLSALLSSKRAKTEMLVHYGTQYLLTQEPCDMSKIARVLLYLINVDTDIPYVDLNRKLSEDIHIPMLRRSQLNVLLFSSHLYECLEMPRKQRIDINMDKNIYIYLCIKYELCDEVINDTLFSGWVFEGMNAFSEGRTVFMVVLEDMLRSGDETYFRLYRSICGKMIKYYRAHLKKFKWRKKRKRRRIVAETSGTCNICFETKQVVRTLCDHIFCDACIRSWDKNTCPTCRRRKYLRVS